MLGSFWTGIGAGALVGAAVAPFEATALNNALVAATVIPTAVIAGVSIGILGLGVAVLVKMHSRAADASRNRLAALYAADRSANTTTTEGTI